MATLPHNRPLLSSLFENDDAEERLDEPEGGFASKASSNNSPQNAHLNNHPSQIEKIKGKILIDPTALLPQQQSCQGAKLSQTIHQNGPNHKHILLHASEVHEKLTIGTDVFHRINAELLARNNSSDIATLSSAITLTCSPNKPHALKKGAGPAAHNRTNAETNFAKTTLEGDKEPVIITENQNIATPAILKALPTLTRPRLPAKRRPPTTSLSNNCINLANIDQFSISQNDSLHIDQISLLPSDYLFSNLWDTSILTDLTISFPAETSLKATNNDGTKANDQLPNNLKIDTKDIKISDINDIDTNHRPNIKTTFPTKISLNKFNIINNNCNKNNNDINYNKTKQDNITILPPRFSKNVKNVQNKEVLFQPPPGEKLSEPIPPNLKTDRSMLYKINDDHEKLSNNQPSSPTTLIDMPSPKIRFYKPDVVIANNKNSNSNNNHIKNRYEINNIHSNSESDKVSFLMRKKQHPTICNGQDTPLTKDRNTISTFDDHPIAKMNFSPPSKLVAAPERLDGKVQNPFLLDSFSARTKNESSSSTEAAEELKVRTLNFRQLKQAFEGNCSNFVDETTSPSKALPMTPKNNLQSKSIQNQVQTSVNSSNWAIHSNNAEKVSSVKSNPFKKSLSGRASNFHELQRNSKNTNESISDNAIHLPTSPITSIQNHGSDHKRASALAVIDFWEPPRDYTPTIDYDEDDKSIHEDRTPHVSQICKNNDDHMASAIKDDKRIKMMPNSESTENYSPNQATLIRTRNPNNKLSIGRPTSVACPLNSNAFININNKNDKNNISKINNIVLNNYNSLPKQNILTNSPVHKRSSDSNLGFKENIQATNFLSTKQEILFIDD